MFSRGLKPESDCVKKGTASTPRIFALPHFYYGLIAVEWSERN